MAWLEGQQQTDGGFSNGFSPESDLSTTADAVLAAASAGLDPSNWRADGASPIEFLASRVAGGELSEPGQAAKISLALSATGLDPSRFNGTNLLAMIEASYDSATGFIGSGPFDTGLAILALARSGAPLPDGAIDKLVAARLDDGSYAFSGDRTPGAGDSNTTAVVVQALAAAGRVEETAASLDYLRSVQNADAGWAFQKPSEFGEDTDANSTALVLQALLAAGEDLADWENPIRTLLTLQEPNGAFAFNASTPGGNILATIQAIPALAGAPLSETPASQDAEPARPTGGRETMVRVTLLLLVVVLGGATWSGWRQSRS